MATLNDAQSGIVFRSGLAMAIANPDRGAVGLAYDLQRSFGQVYSDINLSTWRAIARRVESAREAGEAMSADPTYTPGRSDLDTIPGSTLYAERFQYRVLLTITGENGQIVTTAIDYRTDTAVNAQQIAADLAARFTPAMVNSTPGRNAIGELGEINPPEVVILAAGRRG